MQLAVQNREQIIQAILFHYPETNRKMLDDIDGLWKFIEYKDRLQKEHPDTAQRLIKSSAEVARKTTMAMHSDVNALLHKVDYTDDPQKLYPQLYNKYQGQIYIDFTNYGTVKNTSWEWQKEWRYIVAFYRRRSSRMSVDNTIEWYDVPFEFYDLKLDSEKLKQLEITTSPIMSEQTRNKLHTIIDKYLPGTLITNSKLNLL
jgi:hypothetical protein